MILLGSSVLFLWEFADDISTLPYITKYRPFMSSLLYVVWFFKPTAASSYICIAMATFVREVRFMQQDYPNLAKKSIFQNSEWMFCWAHMSSIVLKNNYVM